MLPQYFLATPCLAWHRDINARFKFYRVDKLNPDRTIKSGSVFDNEERKWKNTDHISFSFKKRDMTTDEINYCNNGVLPNDRKNRRADAWVWRQPYSPYGGKGQSESVIILWAR